MTSALKTIVSKNKRRYQEDGYNLDLAYINDRIIAMGYPSENLEAMYRNSLDDVKKFLDEKHKDHYRIYNLCSERDYDAKKFHGRVVNYPFDDHNPPNFNTIRRFCEDAENWLRKHKENVCAVHCKAGKGRTGVMICCFLLQSNRSLTASEALKYYGCARTVDQKGVTIPSQKRYISYYSYFLREKLDYLPTPLYLTSVTLQPAPNIITPPSAIYVEVYQMDTKKTDASTRKIFESKVVTLKRHDPRVDIDINVCIMGDVKIEFLSKQLGTKKLFHFWFNTFFAENENELSHFVESNVSNTNSGGHNNNDLSNLLKNTSISEDHLLSERLSSDSSSSSANFPESSTTTSFSDKRIRHSSVPQSGNVGSHRNNYASVPQGKKFGLSLNKSQLDMGKNNLRVTYDDRFGVALHLIKPEKPWTPPPSSVVISGVSSSSPESSSTEEEPSDVFQRNDVGTKRLESGSISTWI